jgi:hypothetical protein
MLDQMAKSGKQETKQNISSQIVPQLNSSLLFLDIKMLLQHSFDLVNHHFALVACLRMYVFSLVDSILFRQADAVNRKWDWGKP